MSKKIIFVLACSSHVTFHSSLNLERETGFEPATSTLARSHSTTELFPLAEPLTYHTAALGINALDSPEHALAQGAALRLA